jgi:cytochrome b involved in lipid metabolism
MKKLTGLSLFIFFCIVSAILTAGLVFYPNKNITSNKDNTNGSSNVLSGVSVLDSNEVSKHNTNADCWIIVNSKVYNISNYASAHPGGTGNILNYCGKEATSAFSTKGTKGKPHSTSANNMLDQYYIGDFNQKINQTIQQNIQKVQAKPIPTNTGYEDDDD